MHPHSAWLAFIQVARSNSILKVSWCWRPTELVLCHLFCRTRAEIRKRVGSDFTEIQRSFTAWTDSAWGHLRTKKMSSNAQALDMPHDWRFTKRTLWSHICHTFSSAAVSVTPSRAWPDQRNSSCSGKWAQDDSPASSVMITPPAIWCWTYYSTLGAYCIYDMMYDIGDAFSLLCNLKHLCLVTKSLYVNPLEVLKRTMKSNFSKQ